jgi:hypothetical protein
VAKAARAASKEASSGGAGWLEASGRRKVAAAKAEHEAGVRRQKALLAELGVPDVSPNDL